MTFWKLKVDQKEIIFILYKPKYHLRCYYLLPTKK